MLDINKRECKFQLVTFLIYDKDKRKQYFSTESGKRFFFAEARIRDSLVNPKTFGTTMTKQPIKTGFT